MRSKTLAQLVELSEAMLNGSKLQNGSGSIHSEKKAGVINPKRCGLFGQLRRQGGSKSAR